MPLYNSGTLVRVAQPHRSGVFINRDVYWLTCSLVYIILLGSYFSNPICHNETVG